jgi:tetratricopeptide (TPR) repeat protein
LNGYNSSTMEVPPFILTPKGGDARLVESSMAGVPGKAQAPLKAALKAMDAGNMAEMVKQFEAAVQAAPQFARGWDYLGLGYEQTGKTTEARDAYEKAIAADPKFLAPYVNVEALYIRNKQWDNALKNARALIQLDIKKLFPVMYLHQAVAQFRLNDMDAAKASVEEAIKLDAAHKMPRAEYVLGRVLLAKGDLDGARQHIMRYFELEPTAPDIELLSAHFQKLGTPEGATVDPELERP